MNVLEVLGVLWILMSAGLATAVAITIVRLRTSPPTSRRRKVKAFLVDVPLQLFGWWVFVIKFYRDEL